MAGGTFTLTGTLLSSGASVATPFGAATLKLAAAADNDGKYINFAGGAGPDNYIVRVDTSTLIWVLVGDGAGSYPYASLPVGFTPLTVQLNYGGVVGATNFYGGGDAFVNANSSANVEFDSLTAQPLIRVGGLVSPITPFLWTGSLSPLSINNNGYGFRFTNLNFISFELDVLTITGTYSIVQSVTTFPIALPTISAAPTIRVGDDVTINDPTGNLHDVTDVFLTFEDGTTLDIPWSWIWVWTNYTITFTIPFEVGSYVGIIYISIISVHFGGSVLLGTLQVQYENATGIYKLDPNISNDVRYIRRYDNTPLSLRFLEDEEIQEYYFLRAPGITPLVIIPEPIGYMEAYIEDLSNEDIVPYSTLSVTVEQIKIPNPFASTAFIGG